jgi:hypothetical protein
MSDRGMLFLFSLFVALASLGAAVWLVLSGQAGSVDGLFLLLTCLLTAFAFGLYILFVIRRTTESLQAPAPQPAKTAASPQPKPAAPAASSQPVQTS